MRGTVVGVVAVLLALAVGLGTHTYRGIAREDRCKRKAAEANVLMAQSKNTSDLDAAISLSRQAVDALGTAGECVDVPMFAQVAASASADSALLAQWDAAADQVTAFAAWVTKHRAAPSSACTGEVACEEPSSPLAGTCGCGAGIHEVRWVKADPKAFAFTGSGVPWPGADVSCQTFGLSPVRRWRWARIALVSHCAIGASASRSWRDLSGLRAWIKDEQSGEAVHVRVFSTEWLRADRDFAHVLSNQGETL